MDLGELVTGVIFLVSEMMGVTGVVSCFFCLFV